MEHKMREIKPKTMGMDGPLNKEKYWPSFRIELENLPEAKEWEVGKTYELHLKVRQRVLQIRKDKEKEEGEAIFDILGIEAIKEKKPKKTEKLAGYYR